MALGSEKEHQVIYVEDPGPGPTHHPDVAEPLLDRSDRLIAEMLKHFRSIVQLSSEPIGSSASAGQAAYNNMAMETISDGMIRTAEDLLQLTRLLRELWIIGPLRMPGEGEKEAEATIGEEVRGVVGLVNKMREDTRKDLVNQGTGETVLGQGSVGASRSEAKGEGASGQPGPN